MACHYNSRHSWLVFFSTISTELLASLLAIIDSFRIARMKHVKVCNDFVRLLELGHLKGLQSGGDEIIVFITATWTQIRIRTTLHVVLSFPTLAEWL